MYWSVDNFGRQQESPAFRHGECQKLSFKVVVKAVNKISKIKINGKVFKKLNKKKYSFKLRKAKKLLKLGKKNKILIIDKKKNKKAVTFKLKK